MINEDKTKKEFGYYSSEVNIGKKVVVDCDICGKDRIISKKAGLQSKMCSSCQRKASIKKANEASRVGRKHSEETKKRIGLSNSISQKKGEESHFYGRVLSEEHKEKIRVSNKNRIWKEESIEKASKAKKGKILTEEHKANMSLSRKGKKSNRYGKKAYYGKGEFFENDNGDKIWMRSSWEIQIANYLNDNKIKWLYEPKYFEIDYFFEDKQYEGTYTPDFYLPEKNEYWEVKGYWWGDAKEKYESFLRKYPLIKIKLIQLSEMKSLGLKLRK